MSAKHPEQAKLDAIIERMIARHERSLQTKIGPSEIGTPCDRRLALKLLEAPEVNARPSALWRPTVGTAVHTWLHGAVEAENRRLAKLDGAQEPYESELALAVGTLGPDNTLTGHCDLYDPDWPGIVDWKVTGVTTVRDAKRFGVGESYRTQIHTYARGVTRWLKRPVDYVACYFLPNNGVLSDAYFWHEAYDPDFADAQLNRARRIQAEVSQPENLDQYIRNLPTAYDHCGYCPYYNAAATEKQWKQCAGDPEASAHNTDSTLDGLI